MKKPTLNTMRILAAVALVGHPELMFERRDNQYLLERLVTVDGDEREITRSHEQNEREVANPSIP
jgi:hypothetical protein